MATSVDTVLNDFKIEKFQEDLIEWFKKEQRNLPWRKDKDPYKIWVSEIMLQQTRVDTVIPYFQRFIEIFPTIKDLAEAEEEQVLKAWEGLGYYSRARNLQTAVREVHEKYEGKVPSTKKEISQLKGVGPYTAGAILSIAYGVPEPAVDGNVMRVLSRILNIEDDISKQKTRKRFENIIYEMISREDPSSFNQGLMELGAIVCTPTSPSCLLCPVREHCRAFELGKQTELPVKTKTKSTKEVQLTAAVLISEDEKVLIRKRPDEGLLAKLWEFPNEPSPKEENILTSFETDMWNKHGIKVKINDFLTNIEHVFSHLKWNIHVFIGMIDGKVVDSSKMKLVSLKELDDYAFPVSHQKIIQQYKDFLLRLKNRGDW